MRRNPISFSALAIMALSTSAALAQQGPRTREEVYAEAVAAAHDSDLNGSKDTRGDARSSSAMDPEQVRREAWSAARPKPGVYPPESRALVFSSVADPALVAADAYDAARAPDQNVSAESRFNSVVVSTMPNPAALNAGK